jgi:hypothetical protein
VGSAIKSFLRIEIVFCWFLLLGFGEFFGFGLENGF